MAVRRVQPPTREMVSRIAAELPGELAGMWLLSCWSGLRISEAANLLVRDVFVPRADAAGVPPAGVAGRLDVWKGKGGKDGAAILLPQGAHVPAEYSQTYREFRPREPLFRNTRYQAWNRKSANKQFVKAMERLQLPFIYHDSRKFFATFLLDQGVTDLDVAVAMRHIDKHGRPNTRLVQRVYGYVDLPKALDRVERTVA